MTTKTDTQAQAHGGGWRYSINHGPDGEADYAMVYAADGQFVGNLRTHHAIAICNAFAVCDMLAASPAAPAPAAGVEIAGRLRCLSDIAQDAQDGWTRLNPEARELVRQAAAGVDRLTKVADAGMGVIASLAAAISLLERTPRANKAAASDRMFDMMLSDYRRALDCARAASPAPER